MSLYILFFFNDTATTEIYTLSLHDALPIWAAKRIADHVGVARKQRDVDTEAAGTLEPARIEVPRDDPHVLAGIGNRAEQLKDRKSTRLNSSHANISYAVFCLKKKK